MKRVILYSVIALSSMCASAQEYKNTLNPVFCSLGDTIYTPLDTVLFAFDHEVFDDLDPNIAKPCVYIKTSSITKDGVEANAGDAIKYWNKYEKGYVLVKYDFYSSAILPKGDYQLHLIKGVISAKKEKYVSNDDFYLNFTIPEDLGRGKTTFSGDTISKAIYDKFKFKFPTDIKATGIDNYLILNQEGKEPAKIAFKVYEHYLYADLDEAMYFDDGVKYTLTLPAGSVSAKYRDDIVNLETSIDFVGGDKSGIENVEAEKVSVICTNGRLTVSGISAGTNVAVFSVDGKAVANMITGSTAVEIPLSAKGIYIVTVDGKSYKVIY